MVKTIKIEDIESKIAEKILEVNNLCISTIAFGIILVSLIPFYFNVLTPAQETNLVCFLFGVFVLDQLIIKPIYKITNYWKQ